VTAAAPEAVRTQRGTVLVDLSLEITNGMPAHSFFPSPVWLPYTTHAESASAGLGEPGDPMTYAISYLATLEHVGTHVDAPAHIKDGGDPVDQVPLDRFTGKAICLDVRHVVVSNPGITWDASHWLADRGSRVHGVEGPSTDKAGTKEFPNHRVCRDRGMIHYEWLVNLEQLVGKGEFQFTGYPLKLKGGTGSPVRAVAEFAES